MSDQLAEQQGCVPYEQCLGAQVHCMGAEVHCHYGDVMSSRGVEVLLPLSVLLLV